MIDFRKYRSANAEVTGVNEFMKDSPLILEIKALLENARKNIAQQVNTELLGTYCQIGRIIVEYEQKNQIRAEYGKQTIKELSKALTEEFRQRVFPLKFAKYAVFLSGLWKMPVSDWQIDLDALLRTADHFG